jgi:hypothetical protein
MVPSAVSAVDRLQPAHRRHGRRLGEESPTAGETSCLSLSWVMDVVIAGGRGLGLTLEERRQIGSMQAARSMPRTEVQVALG